jgi:hypothetical protein
MKIHFSLACLALFSADRVGTRAERGRESGLLEPQAVRNATGGRSSGEHDSGGEGRADAVHVNMPDWFDRIPPVSPDCTVDIAAGASGV